MADKFAGDIKAGSVDISIPILLRSTTDNTEVTGKTHSDVTGSFWRQGGVRTAITMATLVAVDSAHADGGFKEVDATNQKGLYRFDIPDAAFATGADWVIITAQVAGAYAVHQFFYLASKTPKDNNDELAHTTYGLAKLVRSTSPANALNVDAAGKVTLAGVTHAGAIIPSVTTVTGNVSGSVGSISGITFPTNFGDFLISPATGKVTVGTNDDKSGYSLTQTFPTNFADLAITATTGRVDIGNWLGAVPNALISGRPDVNLGASQANSIGIGAIALNALDAAALALDAVNEIRDSILVTGANKLATDASGRVDLGKVEGDTDAATNLRRALLGDVRGTVSGVPTTTSIPTSSLVPAASVIDQFKGRILTFDKNTTTAALRGQGTDITANTAAGVLTVTALTTAPVSSDTFVIT